MLLLKVMVVVMIDCQGVAGDLIYLNLPRPMLLLVLVVVAMCNTPILHCKDCGDRIIINLMMKMTMSYLTLRIMTHQ